MRIGFKEVPAPGDKWTTRPEDETWVEEKLDDWIVALRLINQLGHAVVGEVRIFPDDDNPQRSLGEWNRGATVPTGGLRPSVFDRVKLGFLLSAARTEMKTLVDNVPEHQIREAERWRDPWRINSPLIEAGWWTFDRLSAGHPSTRPGRGGHGIDHYLLYALEYDRHVRGGSASPNKDIAVLRFNDPDQLRYVANQVAQCRPKYLNLLTKSPVPGKPGGTLTEKAKGLLRERGWIDDLGDEERT